MRTLNVCLFFQALPTVQFLIAYSMQKWRWGSWEGLGGFNHMSDINGRRGGEGGGGGVQTYWPSPKCPSTGVLKVWKTYLRMRNTNPKCVFSIHQLE